jgi:threonine dehydratase
MISKQDLLSAHKNITPYVHNTPILHSSYIDSLAGCQIYFKCENFQKMGAFKMRGAINAIKHLTDEERQKGVVTHSSGNFAQAVALGAKVLGVKAYIVMPSNAPKVKKNAVLDYGGEVIDCEPTITAREAMAAKVQQEKGAAFLHPYNQNEVIAGQGTAAIELFKEIEDIEIILTPVGGGGLISGTALACHYFSPNIQVIGAEPENVDDAYRSLISGKIEINETTDTIADGLRTTLGDITFPIIQEHVKEILLVSEAEIKFAMKLIWERMKIIIEPSCAVPLAAVLRNESKFKNKKIGIILSGGNVDLTKFFDNL